MTQFEQVLEYADRMHKRQGRKKIDVRNAFFDLHQRQSGDGYESDVPPATQLLRNRSKAGLDRKLHLTYLWMGGSSHEDQEGQKHRVRFTDSDIATLMGLNKPDSLGKRVIADSRTRLERLGLLSVERPKGKAVTVTLLNESGNGKKYSRPGDKEYGIDPYTQLPRQFWTNGWHYALTGKSVAALLAITNLSSLSGGGVFRTPKDRAERHGFSDDVWYEGTKELLEHGLITKRKTLVKRPFDTEHRHYRDTYTLNQDQLMLEQPRV